MRFRFSLRALAILMAMLCLGLASWYWTTTLGVKAVKHKNEGEPTKAVAPFLLVCNADEIHGGFRALPPLTRVASRLMGMPNRTRIIFKRRYYIWFFGFVRELRSMASESSQVMTEEEFAAYLNHRQR
jgi:hypothetical protein